MTDKINSKMRHVKTFFIVCFVSLLLFLSFSSLTVNEIEIDETESEYHIGYINNEKVVTITKPYLCSISYWKNECRDVTHQVRCDDCIEFIELLYEEKDTEQHELVNCTVTDDGMIRGQKCDLKTYVKKGVYELWLTNITLGNHSTICYFSFNKRQLQSGEYVSDPTEITMFSVLAPKGIFRGYVLHDTDDIKYQLSSDIFRGVGPLCVSTQYQ